MKYPFLNPVKSFEDNTSLGPEELAQPILNTHPAKRDFSLFGIILDSPIGIPAGPLPTSKFIEQGLNLGYNVLTYKTVRSQKLLAHPWPNILPVEIQNQLNPEQTTEEVTTAKEYREPVTITNSFGVPSVDPDFWQPDLKAATNLCPEGSVVIGSFQGTSGEEASFESYTADFGLTARLVKETGCKILEVNLSCPNEGKKDLLCFDVTNSKIVVEKIKNEIGNTPLIVKTGFFRDKKILENFVKTLGPIVQGIESINAVSCKILKADGKPAWADPKRLYSGVCGWGIKECGIYTVKKLLHLKQELGLEFTILGVGGVVLAQDFQDYRSAGAEIVLSATGAMWNPNLAQEVKALL